MADVTVSEGVVEEFGESQKRKPKVKIGGQWYFLGNTRLDGVATGDKLSFEWSTFKTDDMRYPIKVLEGWGFVAKQEARSAPPPPPPGYPPQQGGGGNWQAGYPQAPPPPGYPQQQPAYVPASPPAQPPPTPAYDSDQLRLISNFMAAVAPKLDRPAQVGEWFRAISCAVRGQEYFEERVPYSSR
jgi:hypothetical protein